MQEKKNQDKSSQNSKGKMSSPQTLHFSQPQISPADNSNDFKSVSEQFTGEIDMLGIYYSSESRHLNLNAELRDAFLQRLKK